MEKSDGFVSFEAGTGPSWGLMTTKGVVNLGARMSFSLMEMIQTGQMLSVLEQAKKATPDLASSEIVFLPPIPSPEKIICIGVNYANRNREYHDNSQLPEYPSVFMRAIESFAGHEQPLWQPPESDQLDYEGEIAIVIGRTGHRIPERDALGYIGGLTIANEGSIRDWMRHGKFNVTQGKNFVRSGGLGPQLVPAQGQFGDYDDLTVRTRVNGEERQYDTTANLMFSFAFLVHYLSRFFVLKPGDIIATGTPPGSGARLNPPSYLVPGDVVEVEVSGVGVLVNSVVRDPSFESESLQLKRE